MLIPFKDILSNAILNGYAVGYFEAWDIYSLEAVVEAAEEQGASVIIGFGESTVDYKWYDSGGIEKLAALGLTMAEGSKSPMAFIFNEIASFEHAVRGIKAGFNAVMLDSANQSFLEHRELTKQLVKVAHSVGIGVEAELGIMPSAKEDGSIEEGSYTNPEEAAKFVESTNIDALAISIGNVHLLNKASAKINIDLLKEIHRSVDIPLVIHGGSGLPDDIVPELIKNGVAKINVGTVLKTVFFESVVKAIESEPIESVHMKKNIHEILGSHMDNDILHQGKLRMKEEVTRRIRVYNPNM